MKKITSILLVFCTLLACLAFASCGEVASYNNDIAVSELAAVAANALPDGSSMAVVPEAYIKNTMQMDTAMFADYSVSIQSAGANIDEFGIFKAQNAESVEAVKKAVEDYFEFRLEIWMPEYMPEEKPKLEKATIKVMGEYVVYCILADDVKGDVFTAVENKLLGK